MRGTLTEVGRTHLYTRRQRRQRLGAVLVALLGAAGAAWLGAALVAWLEQGAFTYPTITIRPILATGGPDRGGGGLLGLPAGPISDAPTHPQVPLTVTWPSSPGWTIIPAAPLWLLWLRLMVRPLLIGLRAETRHRGLASLPRIRAALGPHAVRRAGRFTLPDTPWYRRLTSPTTAFGYFLGHPLRPHSKQLDLWANWEERIRIVARPGWGKTTRLLVPMIRALPGPALVSSTEPAIFQQTVVARTHRAPQLRWRWLSHLLQRWLPPAEYPAAVVDFSAAEHRFAAGFPRVRWHPVDECENFTIAHRRATALVSGVESNAAAARGSDADRFFRSSATEVLAAWLHAAALGNKEIEDLLRWLQKSTDPVPARILSDDPRADPSALVNLRTHLNPKAATTTSGVERYLTHATNSLATADGRELCGRRFDARTGDRIAQFDMADLITAGGTVYLLADPSRVERARPLLSLFAAEMFLAAEAVALRSPGQRLPQPFIAVLDELRYGIVVPNLPYVAAALRKHGIGYAYSVQSSTQEDAVYGPDAPALRDAAGVSIVGGIDIDSARELSDRAGMTPVVTATRGQREPHSEHVQLQQTLTIGDQQQLADGEATVVARGLAPFLAYVPSIYERRRLSRTVRREAIGVARHVAGARARDLALRRSRDDAAAAGAHFPRTGPGDRP